MQTNKIDKYIADKLKGRELKPAPSAWERLSVQLDNEQQNKKKKRTLYFGYAASIAMLLSLSFLYQRSINNENVIDQIIVKTSLDTIKIKEVNFKDIIPVEEAVVKIIDAEVENKKIVKKIKKRPFKSKKEDNNYVIASVTKQAVKKTSINKESILKKEKEVFTKVIANTQNKKGFTSKIKINSEDLLFAVTHSSEEVKAYYAKYKINRKDIINTIQKELKRSNLKIHPETILAEVEHDIEESDFQQNFLEKFKLKVSDVIVAIADRNK